MDEMHGFCCPPDFAVTPLLAFPTDFQAPFDDQIPIFGSPEQMFSATSSSAVSDAASSIRRNNNNNNNNNSTSTGGSHDYSSATRAKIASHPLYPKLLQAYIDCHKVGAPSDIVNLFEEIGGDNERSAASTCLGDDPELDEFMETYCGVLVKYKSDLARPFNEATVFLNSIETELHNLCNNTSRFSHAPDEAVASLVEDFGSGEIELQEYSQTSEDRELKEKLFSKYSGYISLLKHEFSTKKKKAKLPIEARQALLDWWNIHYKWPYPTEADKVALSECTGLDQKQINNWFINQRKRHWKPSENMQFDVMESIYGPLFMNN